MRLTLDEIDSLISSLASASLRAKEAKHVVKKVHGDPKEATAQLKYAYQDVQEAVRILEGRDVG